MISKYFSVLAKFQSSGTLTDIPNVLFVSCGQVHKLPTEVFYEKRCSSHLWQSFFFNKVAGLRQTLPQVLSREFCEISNSTFFIGYLWVTASAGSE